MREGMMRLGLSLIVMLGVWTSPLAAQVFVVPESPYEPAYHPPFPPAFAPQPPPPPAPTLIQRLFNTHGMCCENNRYGVCSNLNYELRFIFGSCRDFYGEPCFPSQNRLLHPHR